MKKVMYLIGGVFVVSFGWWGLGWFMTYEPTPSKAEVENLVRHFALEEFGDVEGDYFESPKNYAYFTDNHLYVVDRLENPMQSYVVIDRGKPVPLLAQDDVQRILDDYATETLAPEDLEVTTMHEVTVLVAGSPPYTEQLFKVTVSYDDKKHLSFVSPDQLDRHRLNFFTDGYEMFSDF
ncbi:hypothetical protein ACFQO8_11980 [Exiguobacterium aestuarii]|uniref:DUF4340 domain-containing protein n=1 Tax=Exiguobacterium aestuarii TaxID=273527 RepID=A0ABW2PN63_9BACL|nr:MULTISPECIES: hypothetical protein [Exiguobacterium]MCT4786133.1 hypothetical protein [Exiguobacterium aestuarii]